MPQPEKLRMIEQGARYNFRAFCVLVDDSYDFNWHHRVISQKLEEVERGKIKRLMLFLPPRHGKSQLATVLFPAWYLGRNPQKEIITASYSAELAKDFGSKTREIINNIPFQRIFDVKLKPDEKSKAKWKTDKGGSYTSVGIGGAITGRGANILIIDDPIKNEEEAESQVYRNKIYNWYRSTARTRLEKGGAIILIQTRWHLDDLAGRLLQDNSEEWEVVKFPAIATQDEKYRKKGEPLWKEKYDLGELEKLKGGIGIYYWSALYQQEPVLSENQEFKPEWIKYRTWQDLEHLQTNNFLTIDTAISQKTSSDYTGICHNQVDRENFWNLKAWRMRLNPLELIDLIFNLHDKYHYQKIGIEKTIYLDVLKYLLDEEMRKRNKFLPIVELEHKQTAKETRIRGLIPRYESGSIFHIKDECNDLEEELFTFPKGLHDDVLDATAYQLQIAKAPNIVVEDYNYNYQPIEPDLYY